MAEEQQSNDKEIPVENEEYQAEFAIAGGPWGTIHTPVHESLTLATLISTGYNVGQGTTLNRASNSDWEYVRGAVWNDDPACLLFNDYAEENHTYSTGAQWTYDYKQGESEWANNDPHKLMNSTGRSHYGDLQFFHCMASTPGELPTETKRKFMTWLEVLWKLANGEDGITPDTVINKTALSEFCPNFSLPSNWASLRYLLAGESKFASLDIQRRALGSMFHFIQDSYALGHTRRIPLNPQNKISDSKCP
jgi:hypothetical protein